MKHKYFWCAFHTALSGGKKTITLGMSIFPSMFGHANSIQHKFFPSNIFLLVIRFSHISNIIIFHILLLHCNDICTSHLFAFD